MTEIDPKVSRFYREASAENPPAALDAAILAAARRHVAKPQPRARPSWSRWTVPAGLMATLVLGVSIAFLVEREYPGTTGPSSIGKTEQAASPSAAGVKEPAKTKALERSVPGAAASKDEPATAAPVLSQPRAESAKPSADAFPAGDRARAIESRTDRESSVTGGPGARAPAASGAANAARMEQEAAQRSPQAWLDEIRRLRREGRETEAAEQLAQFRRAYPAYAVPEDLLK